MRPRAVVVAAFVLAITASTSDARAQQANVSEIRDDVFVPSLLSIGVGERVTWMNRGRNQHNVVADGGLFRGDRARQRARLALG